MAKEEKKTGEKKPNIFKRMFGAIGKFFRDTIAEVRKVTWSSGKQVVNNTAVVLAVCVICGIALFAIDSIFVALVELLVHA